MNMLEATRVVPHSIYVDNGPEFISKELDEWAYENKVILDFSRSGKPVDNAFIESFNGSFRDKCSNIKWVLSFEDAGEKIETWHQGSIMTGGCIVLLTIWKWYNIVRCGKLWKGRIF